jgi:P-type Cu2+ transporter
MSGALTFCCAGCRNVWHILEESGRLENAADPRESSLYKQALAAGLIGASNNAVQSRTGTVVTVERKGSGLEDNRECVLEVGDMWCGSCAWLITQTLLRTKGVIVADVSFASDTARIIYKPAKTDETSLAKTVTQLGYPAAPLGGSDDSDSRVQARRHNLARVVVAFAFAMNVMMMQWILYAGYVDGIAVSIRQTVPWLLLALSLPVMYSSRSIFYRAAKAMQQKTATMEALVSLGATSAFVYSFWQTVRGSGHVYYDTADMLLGLVMVGKYVESNARQNASEALSLLYGLLPKKAVLIKDGREFPISISRLTDGDSILVKSGERIAADGVVTSGDGTVDESLLSGESRPVSKRASDSVMGGTMLQSGLLTVQVARTANNGVLSQIIALVTESLSKKTPAERLADRISRVFVPSVLILAASTGTVLALSGHADVASVMTRVVSVLVIACPCALGIATPMAISAGVAVAAQDGMLIADGGAFETMSKIKHLVLDKTGTATEGKFEVRDSIGSLDRINLLTDLERCSSHPIASAITSYFSASNAIDKNTAVVGYAQHDGAGIAGCVAGTTVFAGNSRAVEATGLVLSETLADFATEHAPKGLTVIYWGIERDEVIGAIALGDQIRPEAQLAVSGLSELGVTTYLLSGDSESATAAVAAQLGIKTWRADALPTEKADWIDELTQRAQASCGKVCMVGDGVNDAPALARADVGIALASGTDIAARTAQVTLLAPDLGRIPILIKLSRRTVAIVRQNLFWAFLYNTISIPLAMAGKITPLWAVSAMLLSSLTVILNTQRLKK